MSSKITVGLVAMSLIWFTACHKPSSSKSTSQNPAKDTTLITRGPASRDSIKTDTAAVDTVAVAPDTREPMPEVKVNEVDFDYLTAKSKFSFKSAKQDFDNTNVNIRMKKDSIIWLSVTGVGLEVARGIITRDSIVFMDKIHRDYFVFNYEQLSKQYNFDLNFDLLQSVIIGNMPFEMQEEGHFIKENDFYVLKQLVDRLEVDNYVAEKNQKLSRLKAMEVPTQNTFTLDYEDFRETGGFLFPFMSHISLNVLSKEQQKLETTMRLKHSKVELVKQSPGFPFNVPSSYKRKR
ncbi:hypothetical protein GCM10007423_57990 [Dyadobacter endophyticus]|uniref:DUF4292 domain-containing protein n=1 Tax=Dyadobacter endophyticus TaxID=1749036 RepID=A0ABQ1ZAA7_9BACT|nr:DUF4292 domain-containing protein [Dyadobacter endophyticus]GGH52978.1 hypothetical protein GCM10007423_57990 [Dyadobacter endophyticus]